MTSHTIHADRFEIKDPATGKVIASSDMGVAELERVLASGAAGPGADWVAQMIEGKREAK